MIGQYSILLSLHLIFLSLILVLQFTASEDPVIDSSVSYVDGANSISKTSTNHANWANYRK